MKIKDLKHIVSESIASYLFSEEHEGFAKLKRTLSHEKGVEDSGAVAASIGRKKYGKKAMAKAAKKGRALEESINDINADILFEKHVGFKKLVSKLQGEGNSKEDAKRIAYSIGVKKYGKEKMEQAAETHKPL